MIKKIIAFFITLTLIVTLCAACGNNGNEQGKDTNSSLSDAAKEKFELTAAKPIDSFQNDAVIICWGDSLTAGMGMQYGYNYPQHFQSDLNGQYKVINAGVGGEDSIAISSRANIVKAFLTSDIVFQKGQSSSIELDREFLSTADGEAITYKGFGNGLPLDKIIVGGQKLSIVYKNGQTEQEGIYTLVRENTDTKLTLKKGTEIKFDYTGKYESIYCNIILMGANDGGIPTEELIARYKNLGSISDKNIYIIPYYTQQDIADQFKAAFGDNALDMRDYFVNYAHKDYDLEVTKLDEWCIKKGIVPSTLHYKNDKDDCHLNEIGYKVMADQVYKTGVKLGYWK